jgi:hypothetical protein
MSMLTKLVMHLIKGAASQALQMALLSHPRLLFLCTAHKLIIYAPDSMITTPTPGRLLVMLEQLPSTTRSLSFLT